MRNKRSMKQIGVIYMKKLIAVLLLISGCCIYGMEEKIGKAIDKARANLKSSLAEVKKWNETESECGPLSDGGNQEREYAKKDVGHYLSQINELKRQQSKL